MSVHIFPIQSVPESITGWDSTEHTYALVRTYLSEHRQLGEKDEKHLHCANTDEVNDAVREFANWANQLPEDEPKLLWLSLHGKPPLSKQHVGTRAVSAVFCTDADQERSPEIIDWWKTVGELSGQFPPNVVVMMDVCWGGSPSAPAALTRCSGNPQLLFGAVRSAHRLELDAAAGLIVASLIGGMAPSVIKAKDVVSVLNASLPKDADANKPFFRVWWWDQNGFQNCFPKLGPRAKCVE
jgi:hypothetical protein